MISPSRSRSQLLLSIWFTASSIMFLKFTIYSSSSPLTNAVSRGQGLGWVRTMRSSDGWNTCDNNCSLDKTLNQHVKTTTSTTTTTTAHPQNDYGHDHVAISRGDQHQESPYANSNTAIFSSSTSSSITSPDTISNSSRNDDGSAYTNYGVAEGSLYSPQNRIAGSGLGAFLLLSILTTILTIVLLATEVYLPFYHEEHKRQDAVASKSPITPSAVQPRIKSESESKDKALIFAKVAGQLPTLIRKGKFSAINNFLNTLLVDYVHDTSLFNQSDSSTGVTPLELAAFTGNLSIIEKLLAHGARICDTHTSTNELSGSKIITSPRGLAPVWWALKGLQDRQAVRVNAKHEAETLNVLRLLILSNADIHSIPLSNLPNIRTTPLPPVHLACRLGCLPIVNLLLQADKDTQSVIPHLRDHTDNSTALHIAAKYNHKSILESLLKGKKINIESQDKYGNTPLRIASREGNTLVVEYLLDQHAANIEAQDETGSTPLLCAVKYREEGVIRALLSRGADLFARMESQRATGRTVGGEMTLHVSAVQGHVSVLRILVENFSKEDKLVGYLEETNSDGKTALHYSCEYGKFDMAKELLSIHPSPEAYVRMTDNQGYTPLHYACMNTPLTSTSAHSELIRLLLGYNPSINAASTPDLTTPLHYACRGPALPILCIPRKGETEVVKLLLEHGADVEAEDREGKTPVHWTVPMRFFKLEDEYSGVVVGLLRDLGGANLDLRDGKGKTVRRLAVEGGYMEVLKALGKGDEPDEEED